MIEIASFVDFFEKVNMWFNLTDHGNAQAFIVYPVSFELHRDVGKLSRQRVTSSELVMMKNILKLIKFR